MNKLMETSQNIAAKTRTIFAPNAFSRHDVRAVAKVAFPNERYCRRGRNEFKTRLLEYGRCFKEYDESWHNNKPKWEFDMDIANRERTWDAKKEAENGVIEMISGMDKEQQTAVITTLEKLKQAAWRQSLSANEGSSKIFVAMLGLTTAMVSRATEFYITGVRWNFAIATGIGVAVGTLIGAGIDYAYKNSYGRAKSLNCKLQNLLCSVNKGEHLPDGREKENFVFTRKFEGFVQ